MRLIELFENANSYNKYQVFAIVAWGGVLYLDYQHLPRGKATLKDLEPHVDEYLEYVNAGDSTDEEKHDMEEWFQDGAKMKDGRYLLTRELYDSIMHSAEVEIKESLTIYKYGNGEIPNNTWISCTINRGSHSDYGDEVIYELPIGTKVIFTYDLADPGEIIIFSEELKNIKVSINK